MFRSYPVSRKFRIGISGCSLESGKKSVKAEPLIMFPQELNKFVRGIVARRNHCANVNGVTNLTTSPESRTFRRGGIIWMENRTPQRAARWVFTPISTQLDFQLKTCRST